MVYFFFNMKFIITDNIYKHNKQTGEKSNYIVDTVITITTLLVIEICEWLKWILICSHFQFLPIKVMKQYLQTLLNTASVTIRKQSLLVVDN